MVSKETHGGARSLGYSAARQSISCMLNIANPPKPMGVVDRVHK